MPPLAPEKKKISVKFPPPKLRGKKGPITHPIKMENFLKWKSQKEKKLFNYFKHIQKKPNSPRPKP